MSVLNDSELDQAAKNANEWLRITLECCEVSREATDALCDSPARTTEFINNLALIRAEARLDLGKHAKAENQAIEELISAIQRVAANFSFMVAQRKLRVQKGK